MRVLIIAGVVWLALSQEPLVTNTFVATDIREALLDISEQTGVTIIVDDSVVGVVNVDLKEVPLEKALEKILAVGGYVYKKIEDYYIVSSGRPDIATFRLISEVEYIKPKHLKSDEIIGLLSPFYADYIAQDSERNLIVITAPRQMIEKIKKSIEEIDRPPRQVVIETLITEVSSDVARELGLSWRPEDLQLRLHSKKLGEEVHSVLTAKDGRPPSIYLKLLPYIKEGKVELKATPKVTAADGQVAEIAVTQTEYHEIAAAEVGAYPVYGRLEAITTGILLKIRPLVSADNKTVTLEIEPEVSTVIGYKETRAGEGRFLPIVGKRKLKTTVVTTSGYTIALGGLVHATEERTTSRIIPFLSKIPPFCWLLGAHKKTEATKELVIFVTPHVL